MYDIIIRLLLKYLMCRRILEILFLSSKAICLDSGLVHSETSSKCLLYSSCEWFFRLLGTAVLQIGFIETLGGFLTYFVIYGQFGFRIDKVIGIRDDWGNPAVSNLEDSYGQEWVSVPWTSVLFLLMAKIRPKGIEAFYYIRLWPIILEFKSIFNRCSFSRIEAGLLIVSIGNYNWIEYSAGH